MIKKIIDVDFASSFVAKAIENDKLKKTSDFEKLYHSIPNTKDVIDKMRKDAIAELDDTPLTKKDRQKALLEIDDNFSEIKKHLSNDRRKANAMFNEAFKDYLAKTHGNDNKKLMDIVYSKAYDEGHAYGFSEVENHFIDLMDFVDEIVNAIK